VPPRPRPGASDRPSPELDPAQWVDRHADALYRYALARLGDRAAAEDAVQEGLLAALASADRFHGESSERTWLTGIVRHKVLDLLRRARRRADEFARADPGGSEAALPRNDERARDPGEQAAHREARSTLRRCLDRLPAPQRQLLLLREVDGVPTATLCEIYGVTPTNLWTMLHRAKARLRALLDSEPLDDHSWRSP